MSFWDNLAQYAGGAMSATGIPGIADAGRAWVAADNFSLQERNRSDQLALQKRSWEREDNAVYRRTQDLIRAGLNPALAAGSAAQTSAPISMQAPQGEGGDGAGAAGGVLQLLKGVVDVQKTIADKSLVDSQKDRVDSETVGQSLANSYASKTLEERVKTPGLENARTSLENDFSASANPLRKTALEIENAFNLSANPQRLALLATAVKQADQSLVNSKLDQRIKELGVTSAQLDNAGKKIANDLALYNLSMQEKEAVIKSLTIEQLTMSNSALQMSNEVLKDTVRSGVGKAKGLEEWNKVFPVIGPLLGAAYWRNSKD